MTQLVVTSHFNGVLTFKRGDLCLETLISPHPFSFPHLCEKPKRREREKRELGEMERKREMGDFGRISSLPEMIRDYEPRGKFLTC
jgi:hypothetical protein